MCRVEIFIAKASGKCQKHTKKWSLIFPNLYKGRANDAAGGRVPTADRYSMNTAKEYQKYIFLLND